MKTAIVYHSYHHGNTMKLVDAIAAKHEVTLIDATKKTEYDLTGFDLIGFASGLYGFGISKEIVSFANNNLPDHKKVFYIYTSGFITDLNLRVLGDLFKAREIDFVGSYHAYGHITWGPFVIGGGSKKGHPTQEEIDGAVAFYEGLLKKNEM
ncbi:MAG: flavodoxin [Lachnospiraceae bacterium]|nr:flavodoxin [Lachnospiraceae bacterium]